VKNLLKLVGMGDDIDINPDNDQEIMSVICNVLENFDAADLDEGD